MALIAAFTAMIALAINLSSGAAANEHLGDIYPGVQTQEKILVSKA